MSVVQHELATTDRLRIKTRHAHGMVRMMPLMRAFFRGRLSIRLVVEGLAALRHVYGALEPLLRADPQLRVLAPPELWRLDAIQADLDALVAGDVLPPDGPFPAARAYADRIREAQACDPRLLIGHAYARYLGDLAGGPIARRVAPFVLALPPGFELAYLQHPDIEDTQAYRRRFKARIDALDPGDVLAVEEEALRSFTLHGAMSTELWERCVEAPR